MFGNAKICNALFGRSRRCKTLLCRSSPFALEVVDYNSILRGSVRGEPLHMALALVTARPSTQPGYNGLASPSWA